MIIWTCCVNAPQRVKKNEAHQRKAESKSNGDEGKREGRSRICNCYFISHNFFNKFNFLKRRHSIHMGISFSTNFFYFMSMYCSKRGKKKTGGEEKGGLTVTLQTLWLWLSDLRKTITVIFRINCEDRLVPNQLMMKGKKRRTIEWRKFTS